MSIWMVVSDSANVVDAELDEVLSSRPDAERYRISRGSRFTRERPIEQIVTSSIELMLALLKDPDRHPEARIYSCPVVERGTLRAPS